MWEWCLNGFGRGGIFGWIGGGVMMLWPILFLVVLFYLLNKNDGVKSQGGETALDIMKKMYARGEISKEEFDQRKKELH